MKGYSDKGKCMGMNKNECIKNAIYMLKLGYTETITNISKTCSMTCKRFTVYKSKDNGETLEIWFRIEEIGRGNGKIRYSIY